MAIPQEVVRDVYNRFAEGDIDGFLALRADDIEWVVMDRQISTNVKALKDALVYNSSLISWRDGSLALSLRGSLSSMGKR